MNATKMGSFIETYSGKQIDFLNPQPDQIDIEDIIQGISRMPRFSGQTKHDYTVGQHTLNVVNVLPPRHKLQGFLHDAAEAYIGDMPTPFKRLMPDFTLLEQRIWDAICQRFNISHALHPSVKQADGIMLMSERDLLKPAVTDWGDLENHLRVRVEFQHISSAATRDSLRAVWKEIYKGE